ncbi:Transmembrane secretion effector [Candidatus Hepatincola sp. Pdp]
MNKLEKSNFYKLWAGQSIGLVGIQITTVALPIFAIEVLHVSNSMASLLRFTILFPQLLLALIAGVIVDIFNRKNMMLACDMCQGIIYFIIFILSYTNLISFSILVFCIFVSGIFSTFFQVAYSSFIPDIITKQNDIKAANSKLYISESMALILGPMISGLVISYIGFSSFFIVNAFTYFVSFAFVVFIRNYLSHKTRYKEELKNINLKKIYTDILEGLIFVRKNPYIEPIVSCGFIYCFSKSIFSIVLILYLYQKMALSPVLIGIIVGAPSIGLVVGSIIATSLSKYFNDAFTLVLGATMTGIGIFLISIMGYFELVYLMIVFGIFHGIGEGIFAPLSFAIRQIHSPANMIGRISSVQRTFVYGAFPLGSLVASVLLLYFDLSTTLIIGGIGALLCVIPLTRRAILQDVKSLLQKL